MFLKGDALRVTEQLTQAINEAGYLVVSTGAGVSAESGIPTFREHPSGCFWPLADVREQSLGLAHL